MNRLILYLIFFLAAFSGLIFYNYQKAQKALKDTKTSIITISLQGSSTNSKVGSSTAFSWRIDAPSDFQSDYTTIYYSNISTPSALTKSSTPESVGYSSRAVDYPKGKYFLPDTFSTNLTFLTPGRYWYRAYAKVREDNLWTEEKYIDILP